ncbi:MAG: hypothetical protein ACFE9I_16575 [Candidatus Hermodarchaeota archaeon]
MSTLNAKLFMMFLILFSSTFAMPTIVKTQNFDPNISSFTPLQFYNGFKLFGPNGEILAQVFETLFNQSLSLDNYEILDGVYIFNVTKEKSYYGTYIFGEDDQEFHFLSWADVNNDSINDFVDPGPGDSYCLVDKVGSFNYSINIEAYLTLILWDYDQSFVEAMKRILDFAILLREQPSEETLISEQLKLITWLLKNLNTALSGDELFIFNPITFQKFDLTPLQGYNITKTWYNTGVNKIIDNDDFIIDPSFFVNWNATAGIVKDSRMQWLLTNMSDTIPTTQSYTTFSFDIIQLWFKNLEIPVDLDAFLNEDQGTDVNFPDVVVGMNLESYLFTHNFKGGYLYRDDDLDAAVVVDVLEKVIADEKPDAVIGGKCEVTDSMAFAYIGGYYFTYPEAEGTDNVTWSIKLKDVQLTPMPLGIDMDSYIQAYKENLTFIDFKIKFTKSVEEPDEGRINARGNVKLEHNFAPWNNGSGSKKDIAGLDLAIMYISSIFHFKFDVDHQTLALVNQTQSDILDEYGKTNNQIKIGNYLGTGENFLDFVDITGEQYILGQSANINGDPIGGTSYEANSAIELSGLWELQGDAYETHTGDVDLINDDFAPDFRRNISHNIMYYAICYSNFSDHNAYGIWHDPTFHIYMTFSRKSANLWPLILIIMSVGLIGIIAIITIILIKKKKFRETS